MVFVFISVRYYSLKFEFATRPPFKRRTTIMYTHTCLSWPEKTLKITLPYLMYIFRFINNAYLIKSVPRMEYSYESYAIIGTLPRYA